MPLLFRCVGSTGQAHIGIVSSATAILKDMEERGLLRVRLSVRVMLSWACGWPAI